MDKWFHPTLYYGCNHLSMQGFNRIHVCKRGPWHHNVFISHSINYLWQIGPCFPQRRIFTQLHPIFETWKFIFIACFKQFSRIRIKIIVLSFQKMKWRIISDIHLYISDMSSFLICPHVSSSMIYQTICYYQLLNLIIMVERTLISMMDINIKK